jgi:hypothetical protein
VKKRQEKVSIEAFHTSVDAALRRLHLEQAEAESDAAIADYQRALAEIHARGDGRVIATYGADGKPWYVEPHDAGDDDEGPAPVQYLGHHEPDWQANGDPDPSLLKIRITVTAPDGVVTGDEPGPTLRTEPVVLKPPGAGIIQLIEHLPAKATLRKDLVQVVADMREEHFECLAAGDKRGAQLAVWRGRWEIARAILPSWTKGLVSWATRLFVAKFCPGS